MSDKSYLSIYAKSFNWAGFFLPKKTYKKCSMLYDFCRVADNIADDEVKLEDKEKKFYQFENDFNQKNFENPIIRQLGLTIFIMFANANFSKIECFKFTYIMFI